MEAKAEVEAKSGSGSGSRSSANHTKMKVEKEGEKNGRLICKYLKQCMGKSEGRLKHQRMFSSDS